MSSNTDFFSSFDASGQPQQRRKPVPPPRRPAAPPNASSAKPASAGTSASYYASSSSSRPTATSLRPQPPAPPANRPAPRQPAAPSYYSSAAAPQPATTATAASTSANDWYTPSAATSTSTSTAVPSPAAAAMNPYATSAYGGGASSARSNSNIGNSNSAIQNNNYASNTMMGMNTNTNMNMNTNMNTNMNMNANQTGMDFNQNNNPSFSSSAALEGSMDSGAATFSNTAAAPSMSMFNPAAAANSTNQSTNSNTYSDDDDFENEPPLLEELGINLNHIWLKTKAVVVPSKRLSGDNSALVMDPKLIVQDADLAGPLAFALLLGCELLLTVKLSFGYIYGFGLAGCCSMTLILNLMSPTQPVNFWTVTSILGYGLLPVNVLAAYKIIVQQISGLETLTRALALLTILWSTTASTRLLEVGCGMDKQRYLMAYPIAMLYTAFVLITIF